MERDDRTYRVKFTNEGVVKLQKQVEEKLKEFLGDYTDETLVEYVIVLLKNGRRKDEAKNELDVFLGDDSDSFVTWLWDHLGSHLSLYVQSPEPQKDGAAKMRSAEKEPNGRSEPHQDGAIKTKSAAKELAVKTKPRQDGTTKTAMAPKEPVGRTVSHRIESETEKKPSRNRHSRDWKGLIKDDQENEVQLRQSPLIAHVNDKHDPHRRNGNTRRLPSPRRRNQKNKRISEERQPRKRDIPQIPVGGARRLLQFAVRDAVKPSNTSTEPSLKRLRSVVTTTIGGSFHEELPHRNRSTAGLHADMSAAIKAAAEAVKDVNDIRYPRNIFDRLGYAGDIVDMINNEEDAGRFAEGEVVGILSDEMEDIHSTYHGEHEINLSHVIMSHGDIIASSDLVYDDIELRGQGVLATSEVNWVDDSLALPLVEAHDFDERELVSYNDLDQRTDASYHSSRKVDSSINMDTWSIPQDVQDVYVADHGKLTQDHPSATNSEVWLVKENSNPVIDVDENAKDLSTGAGHESQKIRAPAGVYSTGLPVEDVDLRTIYVSNVHFAATNDSLSRHFNKFGEVLKVDILSDPSTGLPKGSAYIEFMRKEAAENSLSLNGTSFMSRILKVVRKRSMQPEAAPATTWPARAGATPYPVPRFSRAPYARGSTSCLYRPRGAVKPARSFQWKREAQFTGTEVPGQASNSFAPRPLTRHLTYVRGES